MKTVIFLTLKGHKESKFQNYKYIIYFVGSKNWSSPSRCYGCIFVASWALLAVGEAPPLWKLWRWVGSQSGLLTHCQLCQSIPCEVRLSARTCRWSGWDCALADLHRPYICCHVLRPRVCGTTRETSDDLTRF